MLLRILAGVCVLACSTSIQASLIPTEHIQNGTFGSGVTPSLANWTTSSNTPTNWTATTAPPNLSAGPYAVTGNANSSTNQRLFQEFTLDSLAQDSATLSWRDRFDSGGLDWIDTALEYRVVLQRVVAGTPVGPLLEAFSTASNPTVQLAPATNRSTDVTAFVNANLGQTIRLSFELVDNGAPPDVSVDTVSFITVFNTASVPEPPALLLALLPGLGFLITRRRRKATAEA